MGHRSSYQAKENSGYDSKKEHQSGWKDALS